MSNYLFQRHIIHYKSTIEDALRAMDQLSTTSMTLIVIDDNKKVIGTLTDGDIRRKLILGNSIDQTIDVFMNHKFCFLKYDEPDLVTKIKTYRDIKHITLIPVVNDNMVIVNLINLKQCYSFLPIDAVIMAGGKGERLRPLTEKTPKPLLPVGDKAIIDHNVDNLISFGIHHINVTVNYLKEQIIEHYKNPRNNIKIQTVSESRFLGTIGAIKLVKEFHNDTILVMNSDLFTDINFEDFYLYFKSTNADMAVGAVPYTVAVPYGIFDIDDEQIKGIIEKPTYNYYANSGIYLIKSSIISMIPDDVFYNATDLINLLIINKKKVVKYPIAGYWIDIGNKDEYSKAQEIQKHIK